MIETAVRAVNGIVWGPAMLCVLLAVGVYYSVRLRFFQVRRFPYWWKNTIGAALGGKGKSGGLSPFRAMTTALAGAIGTGNIVGVAGALSLGGAGAILWMEIAAVFGMATIYAENVLGVKYREKKGSGFVGGPMYYIEKGLRCRWLAVVFAVICVGASLGMGNLTQANSVSGALYRGFGLDVRIAGAVLAVLTGLVIFGGIGRISALTEKLVPLMSLLYIGATVVILAVNYREIPSALGEIISSAFGLRQAAGGFLGYGMARAVKYGISRGVFSNEAGLGSSPIVHAAADTDDPARQGMWGIFQVFIDTTVMCTLMALCILTTHSLSGSDGIEISSLAFESVLGGAGRVFICLSITLFAFATLVSWCYYGEKALEYLTGGRFITAYRIAYTAFAFLGSIMSIGLVWDISDTLNGLMAIPNLAALVLLRKEVDTTN